MYFKKSLECKNVCINRMWQLDLKKKRKANKPKTMFWRI